MMPPAEVVAGLRPGDVLAGKYRVEKVLGEGGMGVVVAARHLQLDERVAIKFLLPSALQNDEAVARFEREARAAVKIKSEHVARVIDVGRLDTGAPYMVMEHLDGGDLDAWLRDRGPMPVEQAVEFVVQACEAIAEAHALGIVHRDLKPANLFCVRRADGLLAIKVLDFGISKMDATGSGGRVTSTGAIFGTPAYMSPEQMRSSRSVDARADIWSLGVILFELVSGRVPFEGDGFAAMVLEAATGAPLPLRQLRPEVPEGFERVVYRCLEKKPEQRFADVAELSIALAPHAPARAKSGIDRIQRTLHAARGSQIPLPPSHEVAAAPTQAAGERASAPHPALGAAPVGALVEPARFPPVAGTSVSWGTVPPGERSRRNFVVGFAAAVVLAIAGAGFFVSRFSPSSGATAARPAPATTGEPAAVEPAPSPMPPGPTPAVTPSASVSEARPEAPPAAAPVTPAATSAGPHGPPAAAHAKPSCNPPFTFDASGTKIFKKECL